jgi:hypothetical protein
MGLFATDPVRSTWIPEVVAVIAAIEAPLMKVRRAIIFSSRFVLT